MSERGRAHRRLKIDLRQLNIDEGRSRLLVMVVLCGAVRQQQKRCRLAGWLLQDENKLEQTIITLGLGVVLAASKYS